MHPQKPLTDLEIFGDEGPFHSCSQCDFFAQPERGTLGHCVRVDPGKRQPYPQVCGGDRACKEFSQ